MPQDVSSSHPSLLPLRGVVVTLKLLSPAHFRLFHQAAVTGFVRTLLGESEGYENLLVADALESGHCHYGADARYRFQVIALAGGEGLLQRLLDALKQLPFSARRAEAWLPLRDNVQLLAVDDLFGGQRVARVSDCMLYGTGVLEREVALWRDLNPPRLHWRWLGPVRLIKPKPEPGEARSKGPLARYCTDPQQVSGKLLLQRCHDAVIRLAEHRSGERAKRPETPELPITDPCLFWADNHYHRKAGGQQKMGGLCGELTLELPESLADHHWRSLILGQYLGIGENRAFGLGRYRLATPTGEVTLQRGSAAGALLPRALEWENLTTAYREIRENAANTPDIPPPHDPQAAKMLRDIREQLGAGYQAPELEIVVIAKPDGGPRVLSIPPFADRVAQRALAQVLTPMLEPIFSPDSHGYRRGRSRHTAAAAIRTAWKEGYRWVFETDIENFFPSIDWRHLETRLAALLGDDPVVELIMAWMRAPMVYQGRPLRRGAGLPQGSPLSPLLANLMLDDFDRDMARAGFRAIRFADDFVVLCKNPGQARQAAAEVRRSLAELDLRLKEEKSAIRSFEQGFRYLGLLFLNDWVLDVSRNSGGKGRKKQREEPPPLPPEWLAMLGEGPVAEIPTEQAARGMAERTPPQAVERPPPPSEEGVLLIVSGEPALIRTENRRLKVSRDEDEIADLPLSGLQAVLIMGPHHITTPALRAALRQDVPVHFASATGKYQGTTWNGKSAAQGTALWLQQQRCFADPGNALAVARELVAARIRHMREVLRQNEAGNAEPRQAMKRLLAQVPQSPDLAALNGIEGHATRLYFGALEPLLADWGFEGRNRRPATDPFNALLSLGYTLLYGQADTLLRVDGLLPAAGCYHQPRGTHAALASDMMEPFRHLVERAALSALLHHRFAPEDFHQPEGEGTACRLHTPALRRYLKLIHERMTSPVTALNDDAPRTAAEHLHRQNRSLIGLIRDGTPFRAFLMR